MGLQQDLVSYDDALRRAGLLFHSPERNLLLPAEVKDGEIPC